MANHKEAAPMRTEYDVRTAVRFSHKSGALGLLTVVALVQMLFPEYFL